MKSQKNQYASVSKTIIASALAILAYSSNANAETTLVKGVKADIAIVAAVSAEQFENQLLEQTERQGKFSPVEDKTILNPESVVGVKYERSIEEVIEENNRITETTLKEEGYLFFVETSAEEIIAADNKIIDSNITTESRPLYLGRTIEDVIAEDTAIIEGMVHQEIRNLDFATINKKSVLAEN